METYRVLRIEEQLYGCEELPEASLSSVTFCWKTPPGNAGSSPTRMQSSRPLTSTRAIPSP